MELEHRFNLICNIFFFLRSLKEEILERIFRISLTHNNKFPIILAIIFERVDFFWIEALSNIFREKLKYSLVNFDESIIIDKNLIIRITYWKMLILCTFLLLANSMLLRFSNCKMGKMHAGCWPEFEFV